MYDFVQYDLYANIRFVVKKKNTHKKNNKNEGPPLNLTVNGAKW